MPPKPSKQANAQKKAEVKQKQKVVEDKTFGLKNKNKSKTVQKMVQAMQASVQTQNKRKTGPAPSELRKERRAEEEARKEELRKLFGTVPEKKKEKEEEDEDPYAELKGGEDEYLWTAEDFEPVELDETRLEEQLEKELAELRERLATEGGGTKVNEESFQRWKEQKRKEKEEEDRKKRTRAIKTGNLTGRMLYEQNQSIFVDDDEGVEEYERDEEIAGAAPAATGAIDSSLFDGEDLPEGDEDDDGEEGEDDEEEEA
eukprot:TRINITY_DN31546_c0_g1_i1.p1 TRINITY_DN31546_c0_g1~~TRINITY_DN31546_c0_g1_i1.p1  ORF type:complete len:258 (+),score=97.20 TRINITY_DN31546_c0_g1_i1:23-796(+)